MILICFDCNYKTVFTQHKEEEKKTYGQIMSFGWFKKEKETIGSNGRTHVLIQRYITHFGFVKAQILCVCV